MGVGMVPYRLTIGMAGSDAKEFSKRKGYIMRQRPREHLRRGFELLPAGGVPFAPPLRRSGGIVVRRALVSASPALVDAAAGEDRWPP